MEVRVDRDLSNNNITSFSEIGSQALSQLIALLVFIKFILKDSSPDFIASTLGISAAILSRRSHRQACLISLQYKLCLFDIFGSSLNNAYMLLTKYDQGPAK